MLRSCDTRDLQILKLRTFWLSNDALKNRLILREVFKLGLVVSWTPLSLQPPPHLDPQQQQQQQQQKQKLKQPLKFQNVSCQQVQWAMSCLIMEQVPKLKKICVESKTHELDIPLLAHYKQHLEDLTLKLFRWGGSVGENGGDSSQQQQQHYPRSTIQLDSHLEQVTSVVSLMPKLKKLKINACFQASFRVSSSSLTKLDVRGSMGGFWISECSCPKLKILRMSYHIGKNQWTGVIPLSKQKAEGDLLQGFLHNHGSNAMIQDFQARKLPCMGLNVPGDCIIKLFLVRGDP
jgi:hypothetical protein